MRKLPQPAIEFISKNIVTVVKDWSIDTRAGKLLCIPGATSDGASIPDFLTNIPGFSKFEGDTLPAAFAHDQLYAGELCPRDVADKILYDLLRQNGVSWLRSRMFYYAVRGFGGIPWRKHTTGSIEQARMYSELVIR